MSRKSGCDVCLNGFVFNVQYTYYEGYKGNMYTPPENDSYEIDKVEIKNFTTGKWEDADAYIDSWPDFESAIDEQIWDDIRI